MSSETFWSYSTVDQKGRWRHFCTAVRLPMKDCAQQVWCMLAAKLCCQEKRAAWLNKIVASAFIEPSGLKYKRRYKRWTSVMKLLSRKFSTFTLLIVRNFKIISTPIVFAPSCYASINMCPTIYASAHYDEGAVSFTGFSSVYWIQRKKIYQKIVPECLVTL